MKRFLRAVLAVNMNIFLLAIVLLLAPLCNLRGQMLTVIVAGKKGAVGGRTPTFLTGDCVIFGANGGTTPTFNATGGNFIVGYAIGYDAGVPVVTDDQGNSITTLTRYAVTGDASIQAFYEESPASMSTGHSLSISVASSFSGVCYFVFSGMKTSGVLDTGSDKGTNPASSSCQAGSETPSNSNSVSITGVSSSSNATFTVDLGFTANMLSNMAGSSSNFGGRASYLINSGTVNPTWTPSSGGVGACSSAVFIGN